MRGGNEEKSMGIVRLLREENIMGIGVSFESTVIVVQCVNHFVP
jgi:hypothetical protein